MAKEKEYIPVCLPTSIKISSRASVCVDKNYYTVEYTEERSIPQPFNYANLDKERKALWDACNEQVDDQISEIIETFKK